MEDGFFAFENCLYKHHVRLKEILPLCVERLKYIRSNSTTRTKRRIKYFTFCAVGALDVFVLLDGKVIKLSKNGKFDTVYFFDLNEELVHKTYLSIPGAIGFPGKFTDVVLWPEQDDYLIDDIGDALESPPDKPDIEPIKREQRIKDVRKQFYLSFPFDVMNFDLEEFLFKPGDPFPGRVMKAMRKVFDWQKKPLRLHNGSLVNLDSFSLSFTTRIGPPNIGEEYIQMIEDKINDNIRGDDCLKDILMGRCGSFDVIKIREKDFNEFFRVGVPKVIADLLMDTDWCVAPEYGIRLVEIERENKKGKYKILHVLMEVKRKSPPEEQRAPRIDSPQALEWHRSVIRDLFSTPQISLTNNNIEKEQLTKHLAKIKGIRDQYRKGYR
jgi:hypothetical protein